MADPAGPRVEQVRSLARGLRVIRTFDADHPAMTLSTVATRAELTRATARRILLTLQEIGYVRTDGRLFSLSPRVLELGYAYLSSATLPDLAEPHLEALVAVVHESASVSLLDGTDILYVARVATSRIMTVGITIGTRFPAYCTSMGRVLLAALPDDRVQAYLAEARLEARTRHTLHTRGALLDELARVRAQGWSLVDQELEEGLRSVAVGLHDRTGRVVAAVNVSTQANRTTVQGLHDTVLPALRRTARAIELDLAGAARAGHVAV